MARVKVRFELNKGRIGAPLSKLGDISRQAEKFLRLLAADVKVATKADEWLAVNFRNGSVSYDAEFQGEITPAEVDAFNRNLEFLADYDPDAEGANGLVSPATALEFARLGTLIDPDEVIGLGIYGRERSRLKWRRISYASDCGNACAVRSSGAGLWLGSGHHPFATKGSKATVFPCPGTRYGRAGELLLPDAALQ